MDFKTLPKKERELLLKALDIDINTMKCDHCGSQTSYENCGIMPTLGEGKATVLCNSILCLSWYIGEIERKESGEATNREEIIDRLAKQRATLEEIYEMTDETPSEEEW